MGVRCINPRLVGCEATSSKVELGQAQSAMIVVVSQL